jgi:hypothetical protein
MKESYQIVDRSDSHVSDKYSTKNGVIFRLALPHAFPCAAVFGEECGQPVL